MQEPLFLEFVDTCLNIVDPDKSKELTDEQVTNALDFVLFGYQHSRHSCNKTCCCTCAFKTGEQIGLNILLKVLEEVKKRIDGAVEHM